MPLQGYAVDLWMAIRVILYLVTDLSHPQPIISLLDPLDHNGKSRDGILKRSEFCHPHSPNYFLGSVA